MDVTKRKSDLGSTGILFKNEDQIIGGVNEGTEVIEENHLGPNSIQLSSADGAAMQP